MISAGYRCTTPRPRWSLRLRIDSEIIRFGCAAHQLDSAAPKIPALTSREREITADVAEGLANKHIARRRGVSVHTVENHLRSIFRKTGVDSRTKLALATGIDSSCTIPA